MDIFREWECFYRSVPEINDIDTGFLTLNMLNILYTRAEQKVRRIC